MHYRYHWNFQGLSAVAVINTLHIQLVVQNHSAIAEDLPHRRTRRSAAALCQGAHWPKVVGDWSLTVALIAHGHLRCIRTFIDP